MHRHTITTPLHPWLARAWAYAITAAALVLLVLLSGCASRGLFENRVSCSLDGAHGQIVSRWGGFGIASDLAPEDAARVCQGLAQRLPQGHPLQAPPAIAPESGTPTPAADPGSAPQGSSTRGPLVRYPPR